MPVEEYRQLGPKYSANDWLLRGTIHLSSSSAMYGDDLAGYQIDDVPSVEIDDKLKQMLVDNSADEEQISLMSEAVIVVDENDVEIGPSSKVAAHHQQAYFIEHSVSYCLIVITGCCCRKEQKTRLPSQAFGQILVVPIRLTLRKNRN